MFETIINELHENGSVLSVHAANAISKLLIRQKYYKYEIERKDAEIERLLHELWALERKYHKVRKRRH